MDNTKIFMWIGIGVLAFIAIRKLTKKENQGFIISTNDPNISKQTN